MNSGSNAKTAEDYGKDILRLSQYIEARARRAPPEEKGTFTAQVSYDEKDAQNNHVSELKNKMDKLKDVVSALPAPPAGGAACHQLLETAGEAFVENLKNRIPSEVVILAFEQDVKVAREQALNGFKSEIEKLNTTAQKEYDEKIAKIRGEKLSPVDEEKKIKDLAIHNPALETNKTKIEKLTEKSLAVEKQFEEIQDIEKGPVCSELKRISMSMQRQNDRDQIRMLEQKEALQTFRLDLTETKDKSPEEIRKEQYRLNNDNAKLRAGGEDILQNAGEIPETGIYIQDGDDNDQHTERSLSGLFKNIFTEFKFSSETKKYESRINWVKTDGSPPTAHASPFPDAPDYKSDPKGFDEAWGRCIRMLASKFDTLVLSFDGVSPENLKRHIELVKELYPKSPRYIKLDEIAIAGLSKFFSNEEIDKIKKDITNHNEKVTDKRSAGLDKVIEESDKKAQEKMDEISVKKIETAKNNLVNAMLAPPGTEVPIGDKVELIKKLMDVLEQESNMLGSKYDVKNPGTENRAEALQLAVTQLRLSLEHIQERDLHLMSGLPNDLSQYKNSYIFEGLKQLHYIDHNGNDKNCYISNLNQFRENIRDIKKSASDTIHLSNEQISSLITSNGGHTPSDFRDLETKASKVMENATTVATKVKEEVAEHNKASGPSI